MPLFTPPSFTASAGPRALRASSPAAGVYNAQSELLRRKRALTNAADPASPLVQTNRATGRALIATSNPMYPARAASTAAKRALISASSGQNAMTRNYYQQGQQMDAEAEAERQGIVNAGNDVGDLTAVAQATDHLRAINALRDSVGIARPIEINTPQGDTTALPVGVTRALRTNAEYLTDKSKANAGARDYKKSALKGAIDIAGTNLNDLRSASDLADLNLGEATQGANYADKLSGQDLADYLDQLKYSQDSAALDLADENLLPAGYELWEDPNVPGNSELVSKAEKDRRDYAYSLNQGFEHIPAEYARSQQRTQYGNQQQGGGSQLAALSEGELLNTLPNGATVWQNQSVLRELMRRYMLQGYDQEAAAKAAFARIDQELATRKQTTGYAAIQ